VVWGDSHVGSLRYAMAALAEERGLRGLLISKSACAPLLNVVRYDMPATHRCAEHNAAMLDLILADRPTRVLLFARWPLIAIGSRYRLEGGRDAVIAQDGVPGNPPVFRAAVDRTFEALAGLGLDVAVLGPAPEIGWDVTRRYAYFVEWGLATPPAPTVAEYRARAGMATDPLTTAAEAHGLRYVDLSDAICRDGTCDPVRGGTPLYKDEDHLNAVGAALYMDMLRALVPDHSRNARSLDGRGEGG
jgi:hypothetical protein